MRLALQPPKLLGWVGQNQQSGLELRGGLIQFKDNSCFPYKVSIYFAVRKFNNQGNKYPKGEDYESGFF